MSICSSNNKKVCMKQISLIIKLDILILGVNKIMCYYIKIYFVEDVEVYRGSRVELKLQINDVVLLLVMLYYSLYLCVCF